MKFVDTVALVLVCLAQPLLAGLISGVSDALWVLVGFNAAILVVGVPIIWYGDRFTEPADFWLNFVLSHVAFFALVCVEKWADTQPDVVGALFVFACVWVVGAERRATKQHVVPGPAMSPGNVLELEAFGVVISTIVVAEAFVDTIGPAGALFLLLALAACLIWYAALQRDREVGRPFWSALGVHVFWIAVFVFSQAAKWTIQNAWFYVGFALLIAYYGFTFVLKAVQVLGAESTTPSSIDWSKIVYGASVVALLICFAVSLAGTGDSVLTGAFALGFSLVFVVQAFREDDVGCLVLSGSVVSFCVSALQPPPPGWSAFALAPVLVCLGSAFISLDASISTGAAVVFAALDAAAIATRYEAPPLLNAACIVLLVVFLVLFLWSAAKVRGIAYTVLTVFAYAGLVPFQAIYFSVRDQTPQYAWLFVALGVYALFFSVLMCWSSSVVRRLNKTTP